MKNRMLLLDNKHKLTIINTDVPQIRGNEVLIKISSNGICGSDIHFYREGNLGNFKVTEPYVPGHECSGTVVDVGAAVKNVESGTRVVIEPGIPCGYCDLCKNGRYNLCKDVVFLSAPPINGTFSDYVAVRADMVYKIPETLSFEQAAMAEPAAVAVHAVNRAGFINGKSCIILGAGPIGLLVLQAFKAAGGGRTVIADLIDNRLKIAKQLGADEIINPSTFPDKLENCGEIVFETAGNAKTTSMLYTYASPGGKVVQIGWPNGNVVQMNIADLLEKELIYIGVNRYANAFATALTQLADGRIKTNLLITHRYSLEDAPEAFRFTSENANSVIKVMVNN